jgi:hypothetical protein
MLMLTERFHRVAQAMRQAEVVRIVDGNEFCVAADNAGIQRALTADALFLYVAEARVLDGSAQMLGAVRGTVIDDHNLER